MSIAETHMTAFVSFPLRFSAPCCVDEGVNCLVRQRHFDPQSIEWCQRRLRKPSRRASRENRVTFRWSQWLKKCPCRRPPPRAVHCPVRSQPLSVSAEQFVTLLAFIRDAALWSAAFGSHFCRPILISSVFGVWSVRELE